MELCHVVGRMCGLSPVIDTPEDDKEPMLIVPVCPAHAEKWLGA
jgi:hypothetical protein